MYVSLHSLCLSLSLMYTQLSFDDIAKYGGVYGEKHSALSTLQSQLQSSQSTLWTGMQGHPATLLTSSLTFNYDLDPEDVLGTIQNLMPCGHFPCIVCYLGFGIVLFTIILLCWLVCITWKYKDAYPKSHSDATETTWTYMIIIVCYVYKCIRRCWWHIS